MSRSEIEQAIPHRPPMLLVDEIVRKNDSQIICQKTFHADEFFFQGHYPGHPLVPGVILCEAAMQAGAILLTQFASEGVPVATRLNDVRLRKMIRPGDTIVMTVDLIERVANAFFMKAKIVCDGKTAVRFDFACTAAATDEQPH